MALGKSSSYDNARVLIYAFKDLRDSVIDERNKRLAHAGQSLPTYNTGQAVRATSKRTSKTY